MGKYARLIGLPVLASGRQTIFDRSPPTSADEALAAWEQRQFQRLRQNLTEQRGVAFQEYLKVLLADIPTHSARARQLVSYFERKVEKSSMSPVARDIVAKFGVLFAAAIMAIEFNVLSLEKATVAHAVRRACLAALAELPDPRGELRTDLARLKGHLEAASIVDIDNCTRKELRLINNADGFHRPRGEGTEFIVRAQVFAGWFGTTLRVRRVLEWLDEEGYLEHDRSRGSGRSNEWAQKHAQWPDGTRVRSIKMFIPDSLTILDLPIH